MYNPTHYGWEKNICSKNRGTALLSADFKHCIHHLSLEKNPLVIEVESNLLLKDANISAVVLLCLIHIMELRLKISGGIYRFHLNLFYSMPRIGPKLTHWGVWGNDDGEGGGDDDGNEESI